MISLFQVFTPDKSNGMDVQSESDAKLDYDRKQKEMAVLSSLGKNRYKIMHNYSNRFGYL